MIQLQFRAANSASQQFLKPVPPSMPHSHRRPQSFSNKIVKHGGPARDTTLQAATKAAVRKKANFSKQFSQMDEIMSEFAAEMALIESMKRELLANQQRMALTSLHWYSALTIQQCYRRAFSRFALKKLKKGRLISNWLQFRSYYRKRCRRAMQLTRWARSWWTRRRFLVIVRANAAARKIQKRFRNRRNFRILLIRIQILRAVKKFQSHMMLFSTTRAARKICAIRYPVSPEVNKLKPFRSFMMSCLRKRRLRLLRSNQGKLTFYVLSMFYHADSNDQTNCIMDFVKRKVGRVIEPPGSSGSALNIDRAASSSSSTSSSNGKKFLLTTRGRTTPRGVSNAYGNPNSPAQPAFSAKDLPAAFLGFFRLRSIYDTYLLIKDMVKVALANPILVDDSVLPTPIHSSHHSKHHQKLLQRKGKNTDSASTLTPASALLSPSKGGGINKGNKYGGNNNGKGKNGKASSNNRLNQHALDEMNNRQGQPSKGSRNNNTSRNIKTPNSVLSNDTLEYENTDSSEDEEGETNSMIGSFSSTTSNLRKSTEVNNGNHKSPSSTTYHSPIAAAAAAAVAAVGGSASQSNSNVGSAGHGHGHGHSSHGGSENSATSTTGLKRLASIDESSVHSPVATAALSSACVNSSNQHHQHPPEVHSPIMKEDSSLLSIKTDLLSSSLTYSDAGSDFNSSMTRTIDSNAFDTPFKHLSSTAGGTSSISLMTPSPQHKPDIGASTTLSTTGNSFYIAGQDSDSDFEIELSDAEIQALLSPTK